MAVDLNADDLDLRRPDPNYKSDPAARGDAFVATDQDDPTNLAAEGAEDAEDAEGAEDESADSAKDDEKASKGKKKAAKTAADADDGEDEDGEDEDGEDEDDRKKSHTVPYSRFNKSRRQVRELTEKLSETQARLEELKSTQTTTQAKEFEKRQGRIEELYEQIEEKRALGESKEAAKLQRELDGLRDEMTRGEARRMTLEATVRSQQVAAFNATLTQLEAVFPELVQDSDEYDEDLVQDLEETIKGYEKLGIPMVDALQRASRRLLRYDPMARGKAAYLRGFTGQIPGDKAEKPEDKKEPPATKKTDIRKNVEAAKKQPADPADDTNDVQAKLDMRKLTPDDYKALPASVRAKLRGDSVSV